jgi:hypothetical protein
MFSFPRIRAYAKFCIRNQARWLVIDSIAYNLRCVPALGRVALAVGSVVIVSAGSLGVIWAALGLVFD